jgi:peptidoglycan/xylan/chitin deacetylase (PgdA/CDA1 family)
LSGPAVAAGLLERAGRSLVSELAHASGALELVEWASRAWRGRRRRVLVLAYHRVVDDFHAEAMRSMPGRLISRRTFARHLDLLRRSYDVVPLSVAAEQMCRPLDRPPPAWSPSDRPLAAITFDDGYEEVHRHAFPLLRGHGFPFTVFVVSGYAGTDRRLPHDRLHHLILALLQGGPPALGMLSSGSRAQLVDAGLPVGGAAVLAVAASSPEGEAWRRSLRAASLVARLQAALSLSELEALERDLRQAVQPHTDPAGGRMLSWDQIIELARHGVSIGAQTVEHAVLSRESHTRVVRELCDSRAELERRLEREVRSLSYPEGGYHAGVVDSATRAGFGIAVTADDRRGGPGTSPLQVPRKSLTETSGQGLLGPSEAVLAAELGQLPGRQ